LTVAKRRRKLARHIVPDSLFQNKYVMKGRQTFSSFFHRSFWTNDFVRQDSGNFVAAGVVSKML
jgi:hypothetical protein